MAQQVRTSTGTTRPLPVRLAFQEARGNCQAIFRVAKKRASRSGEIS